MDKGMRFGTEADDAWQRHEQHIRGGFRNVIGDLFVNTGGDDPDDEGTDEVIDGIEQYDAACSEAVSRRYIQAMYRARGVYPYSSKGREFRAMICTVTPQGELVLCEEDGTISSYRFKEVTYII